MTDILDEVLSDRNDERKVFYLKKALPIVGAITLLTIIIMIVNMIRVSTNEKYNIEMGDVIVKSLESVQTDPKVAIEGIEYLMKNAENHAKDIAALQTIAINMSNNDFKKAIELIESITEDSNYLDLTRSYARLMWLSVMLDSGAAEKQKLSAKFEKYFKDFEDENSAFYGAANILKAIYYQKIDTEKAIQTAQNLIASKKVAPTIREEARALLSNISLSK